MAVAVRSFSSVNPTGTIAAGGTVTLAAPTGLAVGDLYVIFAFFAQTQGNIAATVPTGFTNRTPSGGVSTARLVAGFSRAMTDAAAVTASASTTVTNPTSGTASRVAAIGIAFSGVDLTATPTPTTITWNAAAATTAPLTAPSAGDVKLHVVASNASAATGHATHTPDAGGTKVGQATALASAADPTADSIISAHLGASTVTFSMSAANSGSFGLGLTAAAAAKQATFVGTWGWAGTFVGKVPAAAKSAAFVGTYGWTGTFAGSRPIVGAKQATFTGSWGWAGSFLGKRTSKAATIGTYGWAGSFVGRSAYATITSWLSTPTYFAAHRGGGDNYPEHTMSAYDNAYAKGMKAIELSVHRTSDGVWVCHHDLDFTRMTGTLTTTGDTSVLASTPYSYVQGLTIGPYWSDANGAKFAVSETTARQPIPLLTDVLAKYLGKVVLLIEPKNGNDAAALLTLLDTYGTPTSSVVWKQVATSNAASATALSKGYFRWAYITQTQTIDSSTLATAISRGDMLGVNFLDTDARIQQVIAAGNAASPRRRVMMWEIHQETTRNDTSPRRLGRLDAKALGVEGFMTSNLNAVNTTPEAAVSTVPQATFAGTWGWAGSSTGRRAPAAAFTGSWGWAGSFVGRKDQRGVVSQNYGWTGTFTGSRPSVASRSATFVGLWGWSGAFLGSRPTVASRGATFSGSYGWIGTFVGSRPAVGSKAARIVGTYGWTGFASGRRDPRATFVGTYGWTGACIGQNDLTSDPEPRMRVPRQPKKSQLGLVPFL